MRRDCGLGPDQLQRNGQSRGSAVREATDACSSMAAGPNTNVCATSRRHPLSRRCSVRSCPSGYTPGCSPCSRSSSSRAVRHGSASNHPRTSAATASSGSGTWRQYGAALFFGLAVGRTSPSCHDVRSPSRNCASVGALGAVASPVTGRSAISTSCRCARRISLSSRTGSRVACRALTRRRTSSLVRGSAISR